MKIGSLHGISFMTKAKNKNISAWEVEYGPPYYRKLPPDCKWDVLKNPMVGKTFKWKWATGFVDTCTITGWSDMGCSIYFESTKLHYTNSHSQWNSFGIFSKKYIDDGNKLCQNDYLKSRRK